MRTQRTWSWRRWRFSWPETHNYPLSLELTQYLVTYTLAVELGKVQPEAHPRKETARCIKLAKHLTPWERPHTIDYICHIDGEVFLLDGEIDKGSCEDYLDAIRQAEKSNTRSSVEAVSQRPYRPALFRL